MMTKREQIFYAAAYLFARKSFDGTGIRDIANRAGVNSAMISYYFGGKMGLFIEIFQDFADILQGLGHKTLENNDTLDGFCNEAVASLVFLARQNRDVFMTGLNNMNAPIPEIQDIKESLDKNFLELNVKLEQKYGLALASNDVNLNIFGTATLAIIVSHFLLGGQDENEDFFAEYVKTVGGLLSRGIHFYRQ
jgi:AcrR family transcriptional regulator